MEQVRYYDFIKRICEDFNLEIDMEYVLPLPADKKFIKGFTTSRAGDIRIFDGELEHPYMMDKHSCQRNDKAFAIGKELRYKGTKSMADIINESGVKLETKKCRICEGGGWSSEGTRYIYKDIYCEL